MYCVKCGNVLNERQQFCTKCGSKIENVESNNSGQSFNNNQASNNNGFNSGGNTNNNGQKINIEETSARIVSEVTDTVNNIVDKSKEVAQKIKVDEKLNQCVNKVKERPNTVKVFGTIAVVLLIALVGAFTVFRSTPEKTVKQFGKAIESKDIKKALNYTNFDTMVSYLAGAAEMFGEDLGTASKDKMLIELQKEFIDEFDGVVLKVNNIQETYKTGSAAEVTLTMTIMDGSYIDSDTIDISLVKKKGKWLIDITDMSYLW